MSEVERIKIVQGSDREFSIRVIDQDTKEPFDLTGVAVGDIHANFIKTDGTCLDLTGASFITIVSALGGKIKITMTPTETALLKVGVGQSFELEITKLLKKTIVQLSKVLDVVAQVC